MYQERSIVDQILILEDGQMQVQRADIVSKDGVEIARTYHHHVVYPGLSSEREDARVQAIAGAIHTPAVVAAFRLGQQDPGGRD